MNIDTKNKTIIMPGYVCTSWGNVQWLINELTRNAEHLWGKDPYRRTAVILNLVKNEET